MSLVIKIVFILLQVFAILGFLYGVVIPYRRIDAIERKSIDRLEKTSKRSHSETILQVLLLFVGLVLIILLVINCFLPAAGADISNNANSELAIKNTTIGFLDNQDGDALSDEPANFLPEKNLHYYDTFAQSAENMRLYKVQGSTGIIRVSDPVVSFDDKSGATNYYLVENLQTLSTNEYWQGTNQTTYDSGVNIAGYVASKKDDKYSDIRYVSTNTRIWNPRNPGTSVLCNDDYVAEEIVNEATQCKAYEQGTNGQPLYIGISDDPQIEHLRVLGQSPTKIITAQYQGQTYYIWYYLGSDFRQDLLSSPGFNFVDCTYGQIEQILQIDFKG
jgi:hypothetical protein